MISSSDLLHDLALLKLQSLDLSNISDVELITKYYEIYDRLKVADSDFRNQTPRKIGSMPKKELGI